jgi:hypothetical protein
MSVSLTDYILTNENLFDSSFMYVLEYFELFKYIVYVILMKMIMSSRVEGDGMNIDTRL